jgi:hypothetical protein
MFARPLAIMACMFALAGCAASPDAFESARGANATRYAGEVNAAMHARDEGRINDQEMETRIREAGAALANADLALAHADARRQAANAPPDQAPPQLRPQNDDENDCLLISCSSPSRAPANAAPPSSNPKPAPAGDSDAPAKKDSSCLLIRCE